MDVIDLEDDTISAEVLESMAVTQDHFKVCCDFLLSLSPLSPPSLPFLPCLNLYNQLAISNSNKALATIAPTPLCLEIAKFCQ